jgi:hypothetical protein
MRSLAIRLGVVAVLVAGAGTALLLTRGRSPGTPASYVSGAPSVDPNTLPGIQTGPEPWNADRAQLSARLKAIGLPELTAEGTVLHTHQHIDIFVDGKHVTVPADVGIGTGAAGTTFSPLHTHDRSGIVHVESPTVRPFTLGEFFDVWGVRFTPTCLGGYCDAGARTLRVYVDGHLATGDPTTIRLTSHEEIVVAYGTDAELPSPIPASYTFPVGY